MSEVKVLEQLLANGSLDNEVDKVAGIAKLAIDKGFESLTGAQQSVLRPFLSHDCEGVENPGGHHNDCQMTLEGEHLAKAVQQEMYYGRVLCENCVDETEQYAREWECIRDE